MPQLPHPSQPLSLVSGLACLHLGGGLEGMTWSLRWKKNPQRPIRGQSVRSAVTLLAAEEIKHIFISHSHPSQSADLSFPRPGREESGLEFLFVTLNVCVCGQCVCAVNMDIHTDTDSTHLLRIWPNTKQPAHFCYCPGRMNEKADSCLRLISMNQKLGLLISRFLAALPTLC